MSREDLQTAFTLLAEHPDECFFAGPRHPAVVRAAEEALGLTLPTLYRRFVERLGAGGAGSQEFYGILSEPFTGPIPDAVWVTLEERAHGLPTDAVIVGDTGMGEWYIVRAKAADEPPVEIVHATAAYDQPSEIPAADFGAFLLQGLRAGLGLSQTDGR